MRGIISSVVTILVAAFCFSTTVATADPIKVVSSNWKFAPGSITVHVNQPVELALTSKEGVHGIESSDLKIPNTMILPGSSKTITFTPTKVGTYVIHCNLPCGPGHTDMTFTVKVVE